MVYFVIETVHRDVTDTLTKFVPHHDVVGKKGVDREWEVATYDWDEETVGVTDLAGKDFDPLSPVYV